MRISALNVKTGFLLFGNFPSTERPIVTYITQGIQLERVNCIMFMEDEPTLVSFTLF